LVYSLLGRGESALLYQEKGYNTYVKRADEDCSLAQEWWEENSEKWEVVRSVWDELYAEKQPIELKEKVDGKRLYENLFYSEIYKQKEDIKKLVENYVATK
jgi:hypothetical protein